MSKDADRTFKERNNINRQDDASKVALEWLSSKNLYHKVIGFDSINDRIPPEYWFQIGSFIRNMPDILVVNKKNSYLLEVKGCEVAAKIKLSDIIEYLRWDALEPVYFFIYCSKTRKFYVLSIYQLLEVAAVSAISLKKYPDNTKLFIEVPVKALSEYEKRISNETRNTTT